MQNKKEFPSNIEHNVSSIYEVATKESNVPKHEGKACSVYAVLYELALPIQGPIIFVESRLVIFIYVKYIGC